MSRVMQGSYDGRDDGAPDQVTLLGVVGPVRRHWRLLMLLMIGTAVLATSIALVRRPRYLAQMYLATVSSQPGFSLGGAAALLAGSANLAQGGFQVSPALVASLLESRRVLAEVGQSMGPDGRTPIAELVEGEPVPAPEVPKVLGKIINTAVIKETGLVTFEVTSTDSALARLIAVRALDATTRTYVATARAQASQLRRSHQIRVDSAAYRLARAQERYVAFLGGNRMVADFSPARVQEDNLRREVGLATEVYTKAVGDRESAVAKELEHTPVVVVVDPLPPMIPRKSRFLALIIPLSAIVGLLVGLLVVFLREAVRREEQVVRGWRAGSPTARGADDAFDVEPLPRGGGSPAAVG